MKKESLGKKRIIFWTVILMLVFLCVPVAAEEYTAEAFANLSEEEYIALATKMYWPTLEKYLKEARNNFATWDIVIPEYGEGKTETGYRDFVTAEGFGYAFLDLAEDGVPELVFGLVDFPDNIHSIYGYENGDIKQIYGNGIYREYSYLTSDKKMYRVLYAVGNQIIFYKFIPDKAEMEKVMSFGDHYDPELEKYTYRGMIDGKEIEVSEEQFKAVFDSDNLDKMNINWLMLLDLKAPSTTHAAASSEFILSESDTRFLTEQDLETLSYLQLFLARMEIYARHGCLFSDYIYRAYFEGQSWYDGYIEEKEFCYDSELYLNIYEVTNIILLDDYIMEIYGEDEPELFEEVIYRKKWASAKRFKQRYEENSAYGRIYCTLYDVRGDSTPELLLAIYDNKKDTYVVFVIYEIDGGSLVELKKSQWYKSVKNLSFTWIEFSDGDSSLPIGFSAGSDSSSEEETLWTVVVTNGYLALRNEKAFDYANEIAHLENGEKVKVLNSDDESYWYVQVPGSGMEGYVNCHYIYQGAEEEKYESWYVFGTNGYLEVLKRAASSSPSVGEVRNGELVQVIDKSSGDFWYVYSPQCNVYGYVWKSCLSQTPRY